jgi:hypothetical protein
MFKRLPFAFSILFLTTVSVVQSQTNNTHPLYQGFKNPPSSARPITWWHWTGGNVTKEGITKDLEWMKRSGIGGFQAFDISFGVGQVIDKKVAFMSPEWLELIRHTAAEAERLGLDMTMATSAGWSETGGPWVKPNEAIKKIVWSDTTINGGKIFSASLPLPPSNNGPFRDIKKAGSILTPSGNDPTFYADEAILAFRTPAAENDIVAAKPKITNNKGEIIDGKHLLDNNLNTKIDLQVPQSDNNTWIQFEFPLPYKTQAFTLGILATGTFSSSSWRAGSIQGSNDGKTFSTLSSIPGAQHDIRALQVRTFSFPEAAYKFYRVVFTKGQGISTVGGPDDYGGFGQPSRPPVSFGITEAVFHSGARVNRFEDKANFAPMFEYETIATPPADKNSVIPSGDIIDLRSKIDRTGKLTWQVPAGRWTILRIGYSLTGAKNGPAIPSGTGYEVDKLNATHVESYYNGYVTPIKSALGPLFGKTMKYFLADSYEADAQNWTDDMVAEFKKRRGYDPTPYLPAITGRIVTSAELSDRFLWDFRRTIADLLAEEHYAKLAALAHKDGVLLYSEAAGISLPVIQDALLNKSKVDIPMGEFRMEAPWITPRDLEKSYPWKGAADRLNAHQADVREAASASHIYNKKITGAESWTFGGYESPSSMKPIGDYWNTQGINQFIFHTSVHQPLDTKPGNKMVGTHINRNITWAELAFPYFNYIARNQFMLQQGQFVSDIAIYLGESIPSAVPYWEKSFPEIPEGYDYDYINTEILLDSLTVSEGRLQLPNGMGYRLLVLPQTTKMTPHVLRKIKQLVADGALILGPRPDRSPSLAGFPQNDNAVKLMANELWGNADGKMITENTYGKGKVYWGAPVQNILSALAVKKDLDYNKPHADTYISWIHRRTADTDIYFVSNQRDQKEKIRLSLNVSGKVPEIWLPDNGETRLPSYQQSGGLTHVETVLEPFESYFIVLHKKTSGTEFFAKEKVKVTVQNVGGGWNISFPEKSGAPATAVFDSLASWHLSAVDGIRYFSGTATYSKTLQVNDSMFLSGQNIMLDLGNVKDIAEVIVNGKPVEVLWKFPYKTDVTAILRKGQNQIEIKVTNQWTNRILGDMKSPADKKVLPPGTSMGFGSAVSQPAESGLLGPVTLSSEK